jgi:hypothetical protein
MAEIRGKAATMKGTLAKGGRCPKCTLKPPCKHYESMDALLTAEQPQQTPERGYFYPPKDFSQISGSITTISE